MLFIFICVSLYYMMLMIWCDVKKCLSQSWYRIVGVAKLATPGLQPELMSGLTSDHVSCRALLPQRFHSHKYNQHLKKCNFNTSLSRGLAAPTNHCFGIQNGWVRPSNLDCRVNCLETVLLLGFGSLFGPRSGVRLCLRFRFCLGLNIGPPRPPGVDAFLLEQCPARAGG